MRMDDLRDARRELRDTIARIEGEEKALAVIPMTNGDELRVSLYRERGRPPVVAVWLFHCTDEGVFVPDRKRGLRFHLDELPELARGIARGLEEGERWRKGRRER